MTNRDLQLLEYLSAFLTEERKAQFERVLAHRTNHFAIGLENIYQPHNANAAIRSCDCFGIQTAHIIQSINKFSTSKGVSKGAIKWVTMEKYNNTQSAIDQLKEQGYQIVATSPHHHSVELNDFDVRQKSVFFFGAEKLGLSNTVLDQADSRLYIPMVGQTESLNISVAAAITLQHLSNKMRKDKSIDWRLTEEEKNRIRLDWTKKSMHRLPYLLNYFEENHP